MMTLHAVLAQADSSFWMPEQASTYADEVDWLFYFILGISTFFFLLILALLVLFVVRYRRRKGHREQQTATHGMALEITWTVVPLILVVVIFYYGFKGFMDMATPPANAYEVLVTAYKWSWAFTYPNGHVDENLHVPVDRPVRLVLSSQDVIHSLYIPAFRIKKDVVPGRYNKMWFQATTINDQEGYDLLCAEYCGTRHSDMRAKVYVHDATAFERWLEEAANWEGRISPAERGAQLFTGRGCNQCHTLDGSRMIGPSFKEVWAEIDHGETTFRDGTKLQTLLGPSYTAEDYVRESIVNPAARIVAGYDNVMPSYKGSMKDNDITAMIAYLKTLSEGYGQEQESETAPAAAPAEPGPTTERGD